MSFRIRSQGLHKRYPDQMSGHIKQPFFAPREDGPFQISWEMGKLHMDCLIQERAMLIQDREIEVLELQKFAIILAIIAEILGIISIVIPSQNSTTLPETSENLIIP